MYGPSDTELLAYEEWLAEKEEQDEWEAYLLAEKPLLEQVKDFEVIIDEDLPF